MSPIPLVRSFVVCERVLMDTSTGMPSLVNIFNRVIALDGFPHTHTCAAFVSMVGGHGKVSIALKLVDLARGITYSEYTGETIFVDPIEPAQMALCLILRFPGPGLYGLELEANKVILATHRLVVESPPVTAHSEYST